MSQNKIVPSLWYCADGGHISNIIAYYRNIFDSNFNAGPIISLGTTPGGISEMCFVEIFGQAYSLLNTENEHHALNDAISFIINCTDQEEIDKFWNYFTAEGEESQCGWCIDRYGLRWQIIPENFGELMSRPNAWSVMMSQKRIIIDEY